MHHVQASNIPSAGQITIGFLVLVGMAGFVVWALKQDKVPRLRLWLILIGGTVLAAFFGSLVTGLINGLVNPGSSVGGRLAAAGIAMFVGVFFFCDLWRVAHPKPRNTGEGDGGHRFFHSVMAVAAPTVFLAVAGFWLVALGFDTAVLTQFSSTITALF